MTPVRFTTEDAFKILHMHIRHIYRMHPGYVSKHVDECITS